MRNLAIIIAATLSVTLPQASEAQDLDRAESAYNNGDYKTALRELRLLSEQGLAEAQWGLGHLYENGQGVPQDYAEAVRWYRLAAEQGDASAQYNLGVLYHIGQGVPQNLQLAYMWFSLAAAQEFEQAATNRDEAASNMNREQIARAQQLSSECFARNYQGCAQ